MSFWASGAVARVGLISGLHDLFLAELANLTG